MIDRPIDFDKDVEIDFDRTYSRFENFNGRFQDENLNIEDTVSVLIPALPETTNCLQFKLVLLQSDIVDRDYVVGWGVFPLLNSDFALNEGNFKVPLLWGNVNPDFDKYMKIEKSLKNDLDNWVANLYFEIEKVNLMDIKIDRRTRKLYYQPLTGMTAQELQQRNRGAIEEEELEKE